MILPLETMFLIARSFRNPSWIEGHSEDAQIPTIEELLLPSDAPAEHEVPHDA